MFAFLSSFNADECRKVAVVGFFFFLDEREYLCSVLGT